MKEQLIDKYKIGKFIALGGEHLVMNYSKECVIKIPFGLRYFLRPRQYTERIQDDYGILKKYFGDYFIETEIRTNSKKDWYALLQRKYHAKVLTKNDIANPDIKRQFDEIVRFNCRMKEEAKIVWEFFGAWALVFSDGTKITNIMIEDGKLKMIDIGLIYLNNAKTTHFIIRAIVRWALKRQKSFLQKFVS